MSQDSNAGVYNTPEMFLKILLNYLLQIDLEIRHGCETQVEKTIDTQCTSMTHVPETKKREETTSLKEVEGEDDATVKELKMKMDEKQEKTQRLQKYSDLSDWYTCTTEDVEEDCWFDHYLYDLNDDNADETDEFSSDSDSGDQSELLAPNRDKEELQQDTTAIQIARENSSETTETDKSTEEDRSPPEVRKGESFKEKETERTIEKNGSPVDVEQDSKGTQVKAGNSTQETRMEHESEKEGSRPQIGQDQNGPDVGKIESPEGKETQITNDEGDDAVGFEEEKQGTMVPGAKSRLLTEMGENIEDEYAGEEILEKNNDQHVPAEKATANTETKESSKQMKQEQDKAEMYGTVLNETQGEVETENGVSE